MQHYPIVVPFMIGVALSTMLAWPAAEAKSSVCPPLVLVSIPQTYTYTTGKKPLEDTKNVDKDKPSSPLLHGGIPSSANLSVETDRMRNARQQHKDQYGDRRCGIPPCGRPAVPSGGH
jgi:hypothetical protein